MQDAPYALATAIAKDQLDLLEPRIKQSVSQYAIRHRKLSNSGGGYVGNWTHELAPYLVDPMDCLSTLEHQTVAIVGPGQCGKTEIAQNWLLKSVGADPADFLWYMQTDPGLEAFVKGRINPMIDAHTEMSSKLGTRSSDDSLHFKQFRGMKVEFLSAAINNLINKSAPRIVADEVDAYLRSLGDIKGLLDVRRQTFGRHSTLLAISHPDLALGLRQETDWSAGIMAIYGDSDTRVWYWPCPYCGGWSSPVPIATRVMALDYPADAPLDVVEQEARLLCPCNGCLIEDGYRRDMNKYARWIGRGQEISEDGVVSGERIRSTTAGFWIVGAMSPFVMGGIGGLARARVKAERELESTGEDKSVRQVMVKSWGFPYTPPRKVGTVDANQLADRAERALVFGVVPAGVRFLDAVADVQANRFEYLVRGWGVRGENWVIDRGIIHANTATSPEDWDKLLDQVFLKTYPLADGSGRRMAIRASGYDSGGAPGVTQQAYAAWTRWRQSRRVIKLYGQIGGREVWSILPMKGQSGPNAQRLAVTYPDTTRAANARAGAGNVPLALFNANSFKDDLAGQLLKNEFGDWYVHFPFGLRNQEPPHPWFEQLTAEEQKKNGAWEKKSPNAKNEALDLMVMSHVIAHLHGVSRIDWTRPPNWAAPWDQNTMIVKPASIEPPPAAPAAPPPSSGPLVQTDQGWVRPAVVPPAPPPGAKGGLRSLIRRMA